MGEGALLKYVETMDIKVEIQNINLRYPMKAIAKPDEDIVGFGYIHCVTPQNAVRLKEKLHLCPLEDNQLWVCFGSLQLNDLLRGPPMPRFSVDGGKVKRDDVASASMVLQGLHWSINKRQLVELCQPFGRLIQCHVKKDLNG